MPSIFDHAMFDSLTRTAKQSPRLRAHAQIHSSHEEAVQRMLIAMEPGSYIPAHRHATAGKAELFVAVRGAFAMVLFDDSGQVEKVIRLAPRGRAARVIEIAPFEWHTVVALQSGSILLEVKPGPFDVSTAMDHAEWAPPEGPTARNYFRALKTETLRRITEST